MDADYGAISTAPQAGKHSPLASVALNRNAAQLVSSESSPGIGSDIAPLPCGLLAPAMCSRPRGHYPTYRATWDNV